MKAFVFALACAALCAGCPRFHPGPLPGAPTDATFVDVDGVHVRYRELGQGPAVVLLHGFSASLESWAGVAPVLAQDHRVIALDLKGFGWTTRPEGDYSPAAQAELVWHVLDKLGVKDVAIVGHSWGTSVALSMAVAHPERTRRVALYSAYVYDEQVPSFLRWAQVGGIGELLFSLFYTERIEDRAPLAYVDERFVTQPRVERVEEDLARPGTVAGALATARGHHFAALHQALVGFDKPVLLLWGENDLVTPIRFAYRLREELANAELKVYPRCGHIPMVEARTSSTRDLVAFLADKGAQHDDNGNADNAEGSGSAGGAGSGSGDDRGVTGDQGGGGAGGGARGGGTATVLPVETRRLTPAEEDFALPLGADLAALGAELTPRQYAAPREKTEVVVHGSLRIREAGLYNLDLDRGLDAQGQPIYPVPLGGGQMMRAGDLRARTDAAFYAPGVGVAVKARIDWLDNIALGGEPDLAGGSPATSRGQRPTTVVIKRAWGEVLTPAGTLAVGRMGAHFGLGIAANGGDCEDCDGGDAADRFAFVSPIAGHFLALSYDIAARGPFTPSRDGGHPISLESTTAVGGPTVSILKTHSPATLVRRAAAGLTSVEYAAYVSRRTQDNDVPATYLPTATQMFTSADLVGRGFAATATGGWLRISGARFRIEAEVAYLNATLDQPSLIPGTAITVPVTSSQLGAAVQTAFTFGPMQLGVDAGYASGDDAPGFGAFPTPGQVAPPAGSFDGAQANPPRDRTVDNFRFHPDFRIDQILFREIIGTITDAVYLRPSMRATLARVGTGRLEAIATLIVSRAVEATSTPSGASALGTELDPELRYAARDGFAINLAYGLLLPGAAFDGTMLAAQPAQSLRLRVGFAF
ncbi:MAG: alpha/beta fold hydrolase [Kofleriaceae bacterium]|nr:alpha/beta fold hydrolase [Kofleriaceae bacterium]